MMRKTSRFFACLIGGRQSSDPATASSRVNSNENEEAENGAYDNVSIRPDDNGYENGKQPDQISRITDHLSSTSSIADIVNVTLNAAPNMANIFNLKADKRPSQDTIMGEITSNNILENDATAKEYCTFEEQPYQILKIADQGNLEEFRRLALEDFHRLSIYDFRGQNVFHHAVSWSRINILDYVYQTIHFPQLHINAQDKVGNTPLHYAIEKCQTKAMEWLLEHGADVRIKNYNSTAPIHMAIEQNRIDYVQMIIDHDHGTVYLPGDFGYTPLHYACIQDLPDIARLLLSEGADLFKNCDIGYSAIHAATRNGSDEVVEVLVEFAETQGISGETLIHTLDMEKNFPLHSAVNSGDLRAVTVCLKAGADINAQHAEDKQSAVHYAAAKGSVAILEVMFDAQREKVDDCLSARDILEQVPIHKAAQFNHVDAVRYLIDEGSSINPQDTERRTPLMLAASKGAIRVVNFLLERRANTNLRDKDNRNFLHMAILTGVRIRDIQLDQVKSLKQLLNERDDFGCCPVHYASRAGQLAAVRSLIELGAQVTLKDNEKQSPLHFAAKYGRLQTCKNLLNSEHGTLLINEVDQEGRTPLLVAALYGHYKVIALLVRKGAQMTKDFHQNTALHIAAEYGNHEAVVLLVGLAPHLLNAVNSDSNTALHLAAQNGHALIVDYLMSAGAEFLQNSEGATFFDVAIIRAQPDAAAAVIRHQRCEEAMELPSIHKSPVIGLIQYLPKICILFLDKCITYSTTNKKNRDFFIHYNFKYLKTPENIGNLEDTSDKPLKMQPLLPLNVMVKHNRVDCLAHPLCVTFLKQKWASYGALLYNFRIGIYICFLGLLTSVAYDVDEAIGQYQTAISSNRTSVDMVTLKPVVASTLRRNISSGNSSMLSPYINVEEEIQLKTELHRGGLLLRMALVALFCFFNVILQLFSLSQQKLAYFFDFSHFIEWVLYVSTFLMTFPSLLDKQDIDIQFVASVISVFLGWINLLLYMQRFDFFGIYIVMFVEIFKTIIRVFIVFSFIIVAFALTLSVVFRGIDGPAIELKDPGISIIATLAMMLGELNYIALIGPTLSGERELLYPQLAYIFFVIFIVLIPILLTNLLVGLAVGNIESVQKNARLKRLAMQVEFFTGLERRMPQFFMKRYLRSEHQVFPNRAGNKFFETIKAITNLSQGGASKEDDDDNQQNDFVYLLEELTMQSRQMTGLGAKFDNQHDLLKAILQKMDAELYQNGREDREVESGGEEENVNVSERGLQQGDSNEFHSAAARAQWHAVATRLTAFKKPRASQFWRSNTDDDDNDDSSNRLRKRSARSGSQFSEIVPE